MIKKILAAALALVSLTAIASRQTDSAMNSDDSKTGTGDVKVRLQTTLGDITLLLYGDTPGHRDNFVRLVKEGKYDGVLFHRVINDFMIQTGDPDSRDAKKGAMLGEGEAAPEIEAEILFPKHFHHRGAVAAARQGDNVNPTFKSSGSQFYIVTGRTFSEGQLKEMERKGIMKKKQKLFDELTAQHRDTIMAMRKARDTAGLQALQDSLVRETEARTAADTTFYTPEQRQTYMIEGGTPHLDNAYTVFGRVIGGMSVVDRIQKVETDANDRPVEDVRVIKAEILP